MATNELELLRSSHSALKLSVTFCSCRLSPQRSLEISALPTCQGKTSASVPQSLGFSGACLPCSGPRADGTNFIAVYPVRRPGPHTWQAPLLGSRFCSCHLKILHSVWTGGPALHFARSPENHTARPASRVRSHGTWPPLHPRGLSRRPPFSHQGTDSSHPSPLRPKPILKSNVDHLRERRHCFKAACAHCFRELGAKDGVHLRVLGLSPTPRGPGKAI